MTTLDSVVTVTIALSDSKYYVKGVYSTIQNSHVNSRLFRGVYGIAGLTQQECFVKAKKAIDAILIQEYSAAKICGIGHKEGMVGGQIECYDGGKNA